MQRKKMYPGIQALRGLAAIMVVIHHTSGVWTQKYGGWVWQGGASGVDLFFVISGFVMAISAKKTAGQFLRDRIIRVVPLYWLMTALMIAKCSYAIAHPTAANEVGRFDITFPYVLSSLFFIPYTNSLGLHQPILFQGWTLVYEMFFYLLFSIALFLKTDTLKLLAPVLIVIAIVGFVHPIGLIDPIVLEFLLGMILAKIAPRYIFPIWAAAAIFLCFPSSERIFGWGVPAFFVVMAALKWERVPKVFLWVGDASYSLYLSHLFVLLVAFRIVPKLNEASMVLVCVLLTVGTSLALYRFIERPLATSLKRYKASSHNVPNSPALGRELV